VTLIPHKGSDSWVDGRIEEIKMCLDAETVPQASEFCEFCGYRKIAGDALMPFAKAAQAKIATKAPADTSKKDTVSRKKKETVEKTTSLF
jgi:hypothetical protein